MTPMQPTSQDLPPVPTRPALPPKVNISRRNSIKYPRVTVACPELEGLSEAELAEEEDFMIHLSHPNILRVRADEADKQ